MSRSSDEPDFGEVKGLLRRLEPSSQPGNPGGASHGYAPFPAEPARPVRVQQGPSSAATLFLIANTVMTTATMTSIAWYLFHSAEMRKNNGMGTGQGVPTGAIAWPPRDYGAPIAGSQGAVPQPAAPQPNGSERAATPAPEARLVGPETFDVSAGKAVRIPLQLAPREAAAIADHVSVRGVSNDVTFNQGSRSGPDSWTLPIDKLPELELLTAASTSAGRVDLVFTARFEDGRALASTAMTLVVAAPPVEAPPIQPAVPLDEATQAKHIAKAQEFLAIGQVSAARLVLQRAAESGNAEAALILGDTYDPVRLFQLGARGLVGDTGRATFWYEKADELGSAAAKARIIGLRQK